MKKITLIATLAMTLSGLSAMGQGYFSFSGAVGGVWDDWSTGVARRAATNRVAFLFGTGPAAITGIMPSVPTNYVGNLPTAAWDAILNDPNFHLATNNTSLNIISALCVANGAWNVAGTQPVLGTAPQGYQVYVIGWDANYLSPYAAAFANAAVGWSSVFNYTAVNQIGTPATMPASGLLPFGVAPIPEPATFTLAGLGAAALLIFRRRRS
jgi:hypothetical protein